MKSWVTLLAGFAIVLASVRRGGGPVAEATFEAAALSAPPEVRVGLAGAIDVPAVALRVDGPVRIFDPAGVEVLWEGPELKTSEASAAPAPGPGLRFEPTARREPTARLAFALDELLVRPARSGSLWVGKRAYRGTLRLLVRGPKRTLTAVNETDLERYLEGVVASEMGRDGPREALKAQAVAARSYALHVVRAGFNRQERGFDLFDDDRSQAYRGVRGETGGSVDAVRGTYGEVCLYGGRILKSFYQHTCGGRTEPARIVFQEQPVPPLEGRACAYCDRSKYFRWRAEISKLDLAAKIVGSRKFGPVPAVRIVERTPGGLALKVGVTSPMKGNRELVMSAAEFRRAVDPAQFKSLAFDVSEAGDRFVVEGRGWGHLVGLCQEGAKAFAERVAGATYRRILEYYYPGATVGRAY